METKLATEITYQTTVGVIRFGNEYPLKGGNCFGVLCDGQEYRIVNFTVENLEEAIKRGITWPIKIRILQGSIAVIHDERIPDDWYKKRFCEVCCPKSLLPLPQLLAHDRQITRGERVETEWDVAIHTAKAPKL